MRVVFVTTGLGIGGAERQLLLLAELLINRNHDVLIFVLSQTSETLEVSHRLDNRVLFLGGGSKWLTVKGLWRAFQYVRRTQVDVIQGWMYGGNLLAFLLKILMPTKLLFLGVRASNMDRDRYGLQIWLNGVASNFAKATIVNSVSGAKFLSEKWRSKPNVIVVPNGIDTKYFQRDDKGGLKLRHSLGFGQNEVVVLYPARLDPMKNHPLVVQVAKHMCDVRFLFVGRGTDKMELPDNAIGLGVRHDMPAIYSAANVSLSLSNYGEGFPNIIAESMACGCPVIANKSGDAEAILGGNGVLLDHVSTETVATAISSINKWDSRTIAKGIRHIETNFRLDLLCQRYLNIYKGR